MVHPGLVVHRGAQALVIRLATAGLGRSRAAEDATNGFRRAIDAMEAAADSAVAALEALIAADVPRQPVARA